MGKGYLRALAPQGLLESSLLSLGHFLRRPAASFQSNALQSFLQVEAVGRGSQGRDERPSEEQPLPPGP